MSLQHITLLVWISWLAGWAGLGTAACAQDTSAALALPPEKAITQYVHRVWTKADGLPQNTVTALTQTDHGYLWVGTQDGVARFDGVQFTSYTGRTNDALHDHFIARVLAEDEAHNLWVGTEEHGVYRHADGAFTHYGPEEGLTGRRVSAIVPSHDGRLWVGTERGLFVRSDSTFAPYPLSDSLARPAVTALHEADDGELWVGTRQGVFVIPAHASGAGAERRVAGLPHPFVTALHEDRAGRLWIGTRGGLSRWADGALRTIQLGEHPSGNMVLALAEDRNGSIWVGTDYSGLFRYHGGAIEHFAQTQGLSHNRVTALHVGREGSLWIGTEAGGLNQLYNGKFTAYGIHEGLSSDRALAVFEAADRSLWVGTDGAGVNRLRGDTVTTYTAADGLSGTVVTSLGGSTDGTVWIGTYGGGLNRFRDGAFTTITTNDGLPSDNLFAIAPRHAGGVWAGTDQGLAAVEDGSVRSVAPSRGVPTPSVTALLEDQHGTLWVGTYDGGLHRYEDGRFFLAADKTDLGSSRVLALHEGANGALWIGTYGGGLVRMKKGAITRYTVAQGLPDGRIYQIVADHSGDLWMSSSEGVFRVGIEQLRDVARGEESALRPTLYPGGQGALGAMNGGVQPAGWAGYDGRLWFSTDRGAVAIDPSAIPTNEVPPIVRIERVWIDGEPVAVPDRVHVPPGTETIQIQFSAPSFIAPTQMTFRYRLDGFNRTWQTASERRTVTYTNLDPGTYSFRVRAANSDGVWSPSDAVLAVEQQPYFYQAYWFYVVCLMALGGVMYGGYRLRLKQLQARKDALASQVRQRTADLRAEKERAERALEETEHARRETEQAKAVIEAQAEQLQELDQIKTQFFNNLSHEFRTPLTLTVGPLENVLTERASDMSAAVHERLRVALQNARRLLRLVNQILDFSKLDSGTITLQAVERNLVSFVEGVVFSFSAFAHEREIDLQFDSACETADVYYDPEKMERVLFNLLSNAVKFTPEGGRIDVSIAERTTSDGDAMVDIRVQDSGPGIPAADQSDIFDRFRQVNGANSMVQEGTGIGLSLAKELVELHGGTIRVDSEAGEGATFTISLHRGRDHLTDDQVASDLHGDSVPTGHGFIEMVAADASERDDSAAVETEAEEGENPTILVVDDNADLRSYVRNCLEPAYHVVEARNGALGLERARADRPDLILSDVMMPEMDGHALCRAIKQDEALRHIPIIMLTARASTETKVESLEYGADDYVAKPFNAKELRARIHNLLMLRQQGRELQTLNEQLEQKVEAQVETMMAEREKYEAQLRHEKERAETAARMKSAILNNMSHELRTPMASILGYAQILVREGTDQQEEFAQCILESGERLMDTLNDVLELSRLEAQAATCSAKKVDVGRVVTDIADGYESLASEKGLALERDIPDEPLPIALDGPALERVIDILVENAVKFTDEGHVRLSVRRADDGIAVDVEDTGVGISEAFRPELFEPFHQERMGEDRDYQGEGLGLSIAKRLIDTGGGTIDVESTKGEGARFTVWFPAQSPHGTADGAETTDRY